MYLSKSYVYIVIYGETFYPEELTKLINITPTRSGKKGDKGKYVPSLKESLWEYKSKKTNALEGLEASLDNLVSIFDRKKEIINAFIAERNLKVKCYVVIETKNKENVGVSLNNNFVEFLNNLKATFEVDVYNY